MAARIVVAILAVTLGLLAVGAWALARFRPNWSRRRSAFFLAFPAQFLIFAGAYWNSVIADQQLQQGCDIDICEVNGIVAAICMGYAIFASFAGLVISLCTANIFGKSKLAGEQQAESK